MKIAVRIPRRIVDAFHANNFRLNITSQYSKCGCTPTYPAANNVIYLMKRLANNEMCIYIIL